MARLISTTIRLDEEDVRALKRARAAGHSTSALVRKQLRIGLVDGSVAAVAERRKIYRVLTTDRRDFSMIRVGQRFTQPLELCPEGT